MMIHQNANNNYGFEFLFCSIVNAFLKKDCRIFLNELNSYFGSSRRYVLYVCFVLQCNTLVRSEIFVFDLFMNLMLYFLSNAHRVYSYPCVRAFLDTTEVRLQTKKFQKLAIVQNFQIKFSLNAFFFFFDSCLNLRMNICRHFG